MQRTIQSKIEKAALKAATEVSLSDYSVNQNKIVEKVMAALPLMVSFHDVCDFLNQGDYETLFDYLVDSELTKAMKAIAYPEN